MTTTNLALYRLLLKFGATDPEAEAAAQIDTTTLATKLDLAQLEAALAWKLGAAIVGAMVSMTGIFALIVAWLTRGLGR